MPLFLRLLDRPLEFPSFPPSPLQMTPVPAVDVTDAAVARDGVGSYVYLADVGQGSDGGRDTGKVYRFREPREGDV